MFETLLLSLDRLQYFTTLNSHMIMAMGRGHNISTIVQTLGRATFNGKATLKDNGFDCVRVLTTSNDYTLCTKVQNYINVVASRMEFGDTFAEAVTGAVSFWSFLLLLHTGKASCR